ncbi:hypothetical protein [uncultured Tateyamaria sp.]|uniref:hypothetical protein n=1 Tax=uncultured Tateyamaria sp. TaxID=455651 RepID=UPI00262E0F09|nr:hypothetical protein [uncultured Tateyamaria sp.]
MATLFVLFASNLASASAYHDCTAPLVLPLNVSPPEPELVFQLTLSDHDQPSPFVGQGTAFNGAVANDMIWRGFWFKRQGELHMSGLVEVDGQKEEWQASGMSVEDVFMILTIDRGDGIPLMVRCLPKEHV